MKESKKIINKIKKENIIPKPKWYFVVPNILIWLIYIICLSIGAAAFSVILFSIEQTDFNLVSHLSHSRMELFLGLLPFFWIATLLIILVVGIFTFKRSKKGYKFTKFGLLGFSTVASIILGTSFFIGGGGQWLENTFAERVSYYEGIQEKKKKLWMNPEKGYLSGTIEKVSGNIFQLVDFNSNKWDIDFEDAFVKPSVFLKEGEQVKLIGEITEPNNFYAKEIRPWIGKHRGKRMKMIKNEKEK